MRVVASGAEFYDLCDFSFEGLHGRDYVVFDLEATGPVVEADSVTQIGAVRLSGDGTEGAVFESLVRPWKAISPKIEGLTGITNVRVTSAPDFADVCNDFRTFCGDAVLVTQCGYEFDFPLMDRECDRVGLARLTNVWLDTKAIFALLHSERPETFSTDFLSDYYGINRGAFKRHDALGDARLIARILRAELEEAKGMGIDALKAECIRIKRFVLPPL